MFQIAQDTQTAQKLNINYNLIITREFFLRRNFSFIRLHPCSNLVILVGAEDFLLQREDFSDVIRIFIMSTKIRRAGGVYLRFGSSTAKEDA